MRILLATAAALTERVRIMPTLYVLPMHAAARAAQEIATLDVLSGGRVTLTVGYGGREHDYRAVEARFEGRYGRMDEQIEVLRRIWAGEPPFPGADPIGPRPLQKGGPPILAGVMGPKSTARVARWADGIYAFSLGGNASEIEHMFGRADAAWSDARRDLRPRRVAGFWYSLAGRDSAAKLSAYAYEYLRASADDRVARSVADSLTRSTPDAVLESIDAIEATGCEELLLVPATAELAEIERVAELLVRRA